MIKVLICVWVSSLLTPVAGRRWARRATAGGRWENYSKVQYIALQSLNYTSHLSKEEVMLKSDGEKKKNPTAKMFQSWCDLCLSLMQCTRSEGSPQSWRDNSVGTEILGSALAFSFLWWRGFFYFDDKSIGCQLFGMTWWHRNSVISESLFLSWFSTIIGFSSWWI